MAFIPVKHRRKIGAINIVGGIKNEISLHRNDKR